MEKVALVTDGISSIGRATVKLLSRKGYRVAVVGEQKESVDSVVKECRKVSPKKYKPLGLVLNLTNPENGKLAVKSTVEHFGRLDVLVINPGINIEMDGDITQSYEVYIQVMTINTDVAVRTTLAAIEHLEKADGHLIFVPSVDSSGLPEAGYAHCMSRTAIFTFAKLLAVELAPNVRVDIFNPSAVSKKTSKRSGFSSNLIENLLGVTKLRNHVERIEKAAAGIASLVEANYGNGVESFVNNSCVLKPSN